MKIAVIGTGISGMLAARLLVAEHEVHALAPLQHAVDEPLADAEALRNEFCVRVSGQVRMRPESQWNEDIPGHISRGDRNWPRIKDKLATERLSWASPSGHFPGKVDFPGIRDCVHRAMRVQVRWCAMVR